MTLLAVLTCGLWAILEVLLLPLREARRAEHRYSTANAFANQRNAAHGACVIVGRMLNSHADAPPLRVGVVRGTTGAINTSRAPSILPRIPNKPSPPVTDVLPLSTQFSDESSDRVSLRLG